MPLHDWSKTEGWEGVHDVWLVELLRCVKNQLPVGYRAHLGTSPSLNIDLDLGKPDVAVRHWESENGNGSSQIESSTAEPHRHITTFALDPDLSLIVTHHGRLAAAVEIISPRNKDRPEARVTYLGRYFGYLNARASLLLVDVHPQPIKFSFADALAVALRVDEPPLPSPMAISFRDGGAVPDRGAIVEIWRWPLTPEKPLPIVSLFLPNSVEIKVDLEATYTRAAADNYLT